MLRLGGGGAVAASHARYLVRSTIFGVAAMLIACAPSSLVKDFAQPSAASTASLAHLPAELNAGSLEEELYYASLNASGAKLCNRALSAERTLKFTRAYGRRIDLLKQAYEARLFARDGDAYRDNAPDLIVTSDCYPDTVNHPAAMRDFSNQMRALERKYGGY